MRCACGHAADFGPSPHNGKRHHGICTRCYADLPVESRHLFDPSERPWLGGTGGGVWLDQAPDEPY